MIGRPRAASIIATAISFLLLTTTPAAEQPQPNTTTTDSSLSKPMKPLKYMSKESATCASCHRTATPSIYQQWGQSKHFGGKIGCYECHGVKANYPVLFDIKTSSFP